MSAVILCILFVIFMVLVLMWAIVFLWNGLFDLVHHGNDLQ